MALFTKPSEKHLYSLFRVGFAARLRSETADIYLSLDSGNKISSTKNRSQSAVFFFTSSDVVKSSSPQPSATKDNNIFSLKSAVLAKTSKEQKPLYVNLDESPQISSTPRALNVALVTAPHPGRTLFSLSSVKPQPHFLGLWKVPVNQPARLRTKCTKFEQFHFELVPGSIGQTIHQAFDYPVVPALSPAQSFTHVLLELGVRFRIRSVHGRVLHTAKHNSGKPTAIFQDGPKTNISAAHDADIIFTSFLVAKRPDSLEYNSSIFALKDAASNRNFVINELQENKQADRIEGQSHLPVSLKEGDDKLLRIRLIENGWGCLGISTWINKENDVSGTEAIREKWLMAGPRGKLETRHHQSSWETFTIEYVQQSFDAMINELPATESYSEAATETRNALRSEIAATVAAARNVKDKKEKADSQITKKNAEGGFSYAAAISGLSEPSPKKENKSTQKNTTEASTSSKSKKAAKRQTASNISNSNNSATSNLPRNKASRKAKQKKNKRRNKTPSIGSSSSSSSSTTPKASSTTKTEKSYGDKSQTKSDAETKNDESVPAEQASKSSTTTQGNVDNGPPCAACGRSLQGNYTTAMGKQFHPQCFCCGSCRRPMGVTGGQFRERSGIPYCNPCYANHLASKCARCAQPILETVVTAMDKTWHKNCLTCTICRLPLTETFWLYADKPNEPRCSRCVTGEEYTSRRQGSTRMVNLPKFGTKSSSSSGSLVSPTGSNSSRVRLRTPNFPGPPQ